MNEILMKHRPELSRALAAFRFEHTDDGRLFFPQAKLFVGGAFAHSVNGADRCIESNLVVNQGLDDLLNVYFGNVAKKTGFYIAPYVDDVEPVAELTAANFTATQNEFTNYTEATRVRWQNPNTTTTQSMTNIANAARFTIGTGGGTIRGAGLLSAQPKSATSGVLFCAAAFETERVLLAADKLDIEYILSASDGS